MWEFCIFLERMIDFLLSSFESLLSLHFAQSIMLLLFPFPILADQLTLPQPLGADYATHITTRYPCYWYIIPRVHISILQSWPPEYQKNWIWWGTSLWVGHNLPSLIGIELTNLPQFGEDQSWHIIVAWIDGPVVLDSKFFICQFCIEWNTNGIWIF